MLSTPAWATTTWYVRDGGAPYGTSSTTCNGQTNAVYVTNGGPNCAVSNPMYIGGAGCGNTGQNTCDVAALWASGDTMSIDGDSDITPGAQAQYPIGLDVNGVITPTGGSNCTSSVGENCTMAQLPDNFSIIGTGAHKPQLWGREAVAQVLNANQASTGDTINNLEITQHSACIYHGVDPSNTTDGFPNVCHTASGGFSTPFGNWGQAGIGLGGSNITLENLWIHGMGQWGVETGSLTNFTEENNIISGNGGGGMGLGQFDGGGSITLSGTITVSGEVIVFNGCGEHYPMHSSNPYDTANYHHCADDGSSNGNMLADGWACEASSCDTTGTTVNMSNSDISFNTKGGIDNLHADGAGTFNSYRVRAEGNESQQVKLNYNAVNLENSQFINDCNYFQGQSFTTTLDACGNSLPHSYAINACQGNGQAYIANFDFCRASGNTIRLAIGAPETVKISNSTLFSNAGANVEYSGNCTASPTVTMKNNLIVNAPDYLNSGTQTNFFEDDTTSGPCVTTTEDYNLNYLPNSSQCAGAHDICTNPSNAAVVGNFTLNGNSGTSYTLTGLATQFYPAPAGALVNAANNAISLSGTSNDYNNFSRGSNWDIGAYQHNSTVPLNDYCFVGGDTCASGSCINNICTASSSGNGFRSYLTGAIKIAGLSSR